MHAQLAHFAHFPWRSRFAHAQNALSSFTEAGSQLGGLGKSLAMPKIGSILKEKSQFLPISKLGGMFV